MKSQTRTSRGEGGRRIVPLGLLGALTALVTIVALFGSPAASADEEGSGCIDPSGRPASNLVGASFTISGNEATYKFQSANTGSTEGVPGLIKYCVYPDPGGTNTLPDSVTVDETPGTGAEGWNESFFTDPPAPDAFSFDRNGGNSSNIPLDGSTRTMGSATWSGGAPTEQTILLHINDEAECNRLGQEVETCWVLPGTPERPPAESLTATKGATPSFERAFEWEVEKEVDKTKVEIAEGGTASFDYTVKVSHDEGTDSGWTVSGTIIVNNPNSGEVTGVDVEDSINDANANCVVTGGSNATIPKESLVKFPYSCKYSGAPESGLETNTAIISWGEQIVDGRLLDEGTAEAEAEVDWEGTEPTIVDGGVEVNDTLGGELGTVSWEDPSPATFEYSHEFEGDPAGTCTGHDNTATFKTGDSGTEGSAEREVEVCVGADLEAGKTATPSFKRTFPWSIAKEVDKTSVSGQVGGNATFNYTITVTKGTGVDSDWAVGGTITVDNPNDWEAITVDVADEIEADANAECTVTEGEDAVIPAGESREFAYSCTYSAAPESDSETNKATVTWDREAASTPNGSATGTAPVDWAGTGPALVDDCAEVTDSVDGVPTQLDGSLCESKTYTTEATFPIESGCVAHDNTAAFKTGDSGTEGSASREVEVCGYLETGALTMGFWQNKNGQRIITGQSGSPCPSATWLRQYAPFQDLSATASCKAVATYVANVIKAANASGASMNAMLKAQMLATALDVYFSDPALGGNQIKAPAPIGGQEIDLTKVCKDIATCTVFEDAGSAFGGATSLTVSQILAYAASQSNVGGSSWYGQVKATQELAKDTFDAINNEVAFGP